MNFGTNAEMRWDAARDLGYLVPAERFFVRNHTRTPHDRSRDVAAARVRAGRAPAARALVPRSSSGSTRDAIVSAIECAGNGRSFFGSQQGTPAAGTQWKLGAIGVARWRGVPLREVLERAGVRARRRRRAARPASTTRTSAAASTTATCAGRSRSARRSTTR